MEHLKSCRVGVVSKSFKFVKLKSVKWLPVYLLECELDVKCESWRSLFHGNKNKANYLLESKPFSKSSAQESLLFCKEKIKT